MSEWQRNGVAMAGALAVLFATAIVWSVVAADEVDTGSLSPALIEGAEPAAGAQAIRAYGCGTCHTVPGVRGATGTVGPSLARFALRDYIAGNVLNTPENLVLWIVTPEAIEPGTAMPTIGVSEDDARDIAAYLYTLD